MANEIAFFLIVGLARVGWMCLILSRINPKNVRDKSGGGFCVAFNDYTNASNCKNSTCLSFFFFSFSLSL